MATPGDLVRIIAKVLGLSVGTVTQVDRNLASAGLRTKTGRGPSAAQVTSQDAANLLIAIAGAPISGAWVKEAERICLAYRSLRAYGVMTKFGDFSRLKSRYPTLKTLTHRHTLGDAIATLIDSIDAGEFGSSNDSSSYGPISVSFEGPRPQGTIVVDAYRRVHLSYRVNKVFLGNLDADFRQERHLGLATLHEIAKVIGASNTLGRERNGQRRKTLPQNHLRRDER